MKYLLLSTAAKVRRTSLDITFIRALLVLYSFIVAVIFSTECYEQKVAVIAKTICRYEAIEWDIFRSGIMYVYVAGNGSIRSTERGAMRLPWSVYCIYTVVLSHGGCYKPTLWSKLLLEPVSLNVTSRVLFNKTNRRANFPNLFLSRNSTCFGQFLCSSLGVFHCTLGTGICHACLMTYTSAEGIVENS